MATVVSITNPITGAVEQVDKLDHTAQQIDDAVALAPQLSNPNLLDNWYFGNPVNQRGQTSYTDAGYGIDRWKSDENVIIKVTDGGIRAEHSADSSYRYFGQNLPPEIIPSLAGKKVTWSILVGKINTGAARAYIYVGSSVFGMISPLVAGINTITFTMPNTLTASTAVQVRIQLMGVASIDVVATKLELGSQQTLAHQDADGNWVLNEIPDYCEQLARCQRYFVSVRGGITGLYTNFAFGYASSNNFAYVTCPIPVAMRTSPAISVTGSFRLSVNGGKSDLTVTAIESGSNSTAALIRLGVRVESGATQGDIIMLQADNDNSADIYLSADL